MRLSTAFILLFLLLWMAGTIWAAAQVFEAVSGDGSIHVRVSGHDGRFAIDVPAFIAVRALRHGSWSCGGAHLVSHHDLHEWAPALRAALTELEAYDDVPLLEIEDGGSLVRMHKHGGRFVLEVDEGRESVRITMPVGTVRRVLAERGA